MYTVSGKLPEAEKDAVAVATALDAMGYYVHGSKEGSLARVDLETPQLIEQAFLHFLHGQSNASTNCSERRAVIDQFSCVCLFPCCYSSGARRQKAKHLLVYFSGHSGSGTVTKTIGKGKDKIQVRRPVSQLVALNNEDYSLDFEELFKTALMQQNDVQLGIILDGCRTHEPLKKTGAATGAKKEAAGVRSPPNGFNAFACEPGVGADASSVATGGHSQYTHKLLKHMSTPMDINELFRRVCGEVYEATKPKKKAKNGETPIETWYHESIKNADAGYSLHPQWKTQWTKEQEAIQQAKKQQQEEAAKAVKDAAKEVKEAQKKLDAATAKEAKIKTKEMAD